MAYCGYAKAIKQRCPARWPKIRPPTKWCAVPRKPTRNQISLRYPVLKSPASWLLWGRIGGKRRMETMTAAQRREVASKAAKTLGEARKETLLSPYFLKTACNEHFKLDQS